MPSARSRRCSPAPAIDRRGAEPRRLRPQQVLLLALLRLPVQELLRTAARARRRAPARRVGRARAGRAARLDDFLFAGIYPSSLVDSRDRPGRARRRLPAVARGRPRRRSTPSVAPGDRDRHGAFSSSRCRARIVDRISSGRPSASGRALSLTPVGRRAAADRQPARRRCCVARHRRRGHPASSSPAAQIFSSGGVRIVARGIADDRAGACGDQPRAGCAPAHGLMYWRWDPGEGRAAVRPVPQPQSFRHLDRDRDPAVPRVSAGARVGPPSSGHRRRRRRGSSGCSALVDGRSIWLAAAICLMLVALVGLAVTVRDGRAGRARCCWAPVCAARRAGSTVGAGRSPRSVVAVVRGGAARSVRRAARSAFGARRRRGGGSHEHLAGDAARRQRLLADGNAAPGRSTRSCWCTSARRRCSGSTPRTTTICRSRRREGC